MDQWNLIIMEYTQKGTFAQAELQSCFMDSKCPDKGNVHEFLDSLCIKKEKLATYGVVIKDKDYQSMIISSLPLFLSNFTSSLLVNARILAVSGKASKTNDKDEAMVASSSGKGKKDQKPCSMCWNCGDKGHYRRLG